MSRPTLVILVGLAALTVALGAGYLAWRSTEPDAVAPAFQAVVIKPGNFLAEQVAEATEAGGRVPPNQIDFQAEVTGLALADVKASATGKAFLDLLRKSGVDSRTLDRSIVIRSRDGEHITAEGGDALNDGNMSVLVVPRDIVGMFDDERSAFLLIRMRIAGLQ
jgi:hypothetical protein